MTEQSHTETGFPQAQEADPRKEERPSLSRAFGIRSWLQDILESLLLIAILYFVVNSVTGRYQVHGQSMEPTLHNGQYLLASKATYWFHPPERGDIVVLNPPAEGTRVLVPYIKRVIGLPGDFVEMRDRRVWVNGIALNEPYLDQNTDYLGSWKLGEDEYFVLGDNRNNSSDSHTWGTLRQEHLLGKAVFCYWPPEDWGAIVHYTYVELESVQ